MQNYFNDVAEFIAKNIGAKLSFFAFFRAENSDFVRFNKGKIRQPGYVEQKYLDLNLVSGKKCLKSTISLEGSLQQDKDRLLAAIKKLQSNIDHIPDDPFLSYSKSKISNCDSTKNIFDATEVAEQVTKTVEGLDFVGILSGGPIFRGFANSEGQRSWFEKTSFNLDYSLYLEGSNAAKSNYSGFLFDPIIFEAQIAKGKNELKALAKPRVELKPGKYNAYFSPSSMNELLSLLSWGGFGIKGHKSKTSPFLKLSSGLNTLDARINLCENIKDSLGPSFHEQGFVKPPIIDLIKEGKWNNYLVSPRSSKEFGCEHNGANFEESPSSLDLGSGNLKNDDILTRLGTGVFINNLWYLNYSDKSNGRATGMTRFACFWVENGHIVAPMQPMRFDDTVYNILGRNLIDLTSQKELLVDPGTYNQRATLCSRLPGALVNDFNLTL